MSQPDRVLPWQDVLPGDVIRGADERPWRIVERGRRSITMTDEGGFVRTGQPDSRSVVALLAPGVPRACLDVFHQGDLPATVIHEGK